MAPPTAKSAGHRPSRRRDIVAGAITAFARYGFADTSIHAVATEAGVAPTAIYYHFSGKDDLFEAALREVMDSINTAVEDARHAQERPDPEPLGTVITAVWAWMDANPDGALLLSHHLPGATARARVVQEEFEQVHMEQALDHLAPAGPRRGARRAPLAQLASQTLEVRTLIATLVSIHPMRAEDGPLAKQSAASTLKALLEVSGRVISVA